MADSEIRAEVDKDDLIKAIHDARAMWQLELKAWQEKFEEDVDEFIATKRVGLFWLFKPSRHKAEKILLGRFYWKPGYKIREINKKLLRLYRIEPMCKYKNITLPESDIKLLDGFL